MTDTTFAFLFLLAALNGFVIGAIWRQLAVIKLRAERNSWERQARELASHFQPMPPMRLIECAGHPVLWPEECAEPEGEVEWPEALEELA
jgi:hypothetical protein